MEPNGEFFGIFNTLPHTLVLNHYTKFEHFKIENQTKLITKLEYFIYVTWYPGTS